MGGHLGDLGAMRHQHAGHRSVKRKTRRQLRFPLSADFAWKKQGKISAFLLLRRAQKRTPLAIVRAATVNNAQHTDNTNKLGVALVPEDKPVEPDPGSSGDGKL